MTHSAQATETRISFFINPATRRFSLDHGLKQAPDTRDSEIVAAAQAGSPTAFDELQRIYSGKLFKTVFRITRNREDAEDAVQDTFLRAYMALRYFEARASVYSWLTRIAINSALMILRRRRTRPETLLSSPVDGGDDHPRLEITDTAPNPEQMFELRQRSNCLRNALGRLEPLLRAPIEIQLSEERSMKEIADTLNISVAATKARLHRARTNLARRIAKTSGTRGYLGETVCDNRSKLPCHESSRA